jgi:hypothetical protein
MHQDTPIFELHIRPTYAVRIPQRNGQGINLTERQIKNQENLSNNQLTGVLSSKASRRLSNSVNWLIASAKQKSILDRKTNKRFSFKINFITLTLPTTEHGISDNYFKSKLLHNFINTCRYKYDLKNYVWKVETQENGNIHAHFTTDTFIHYEELRKVWNTILSKHGILQKYTSKHLKLSFSDYCNAYYKEGKTTIEQLQKAYDFGVATKWTQPNSTDVHAVHKVKDIGAYLAKYMSKKEEGRRIIKGRVWSCSVNLSDKNKLVVELLGNEGTEYLHYLMKPNIRWKVIESINKKTGLIKNVGEVYFYKMSDWGTSIKGKLLDVFNEHRFKIRHNIAIDNNQYIQPKEIIQPIYYSLQIPEISTINQFQLTI